MKNKENIWQLIQRLDEQAGEFNVHIATANKVFDETAKKTSKVVERHQKDMHRTIVKLKKALKAFQHKKGNEK